MEYKKNRNLYHHLHIYSRSFARAQTNKHTSARMLTQIQMMDVCVCLSSLSTVIIGIVEEKCECERQAFA